MGCTLPTSVIPQIRYFVIGVWLTWLFKGPLLSHLLLISTITNHTPAWGSHYTMSSCEGCQKPKHSLFNYSSYSRLKPTKPKPKPNCYWVTSNILLFTNALSENIISRTPHLPLAHQRSDSKACPLVCHAALAAWQTHSLQPGISLSVKITTGAWAFWRIGLLFLCLPVFLGFWFFLNVESYY